MSATTAYVGLGSNLDDREGLITAALDELRAHPEIRVAAVSTLRETEPWGPVEQPAFLNGACSVETTLSPLELLDALLDIERGLGRVRAERYGPRRIDLDILLFGDHELDTDRLTIPHPRLVERVFALEPLVELDPDVSLPDGTLLRDILASGRR